MTGLGKHLVAGEGHDRLPFRGDCPICRASRLTGVLPDGRVLSPRARAGIAAAVLVGSSLSPAMAAAQPPPLSPSEEEALRQIDQLEQQRPQEAAPVLPEAPTPEEQQDIDVTPDEAPTPAPPEGEPPPEQDVSEPAPPVEPAPPPVEPAPVEAPPPLEPAPQVEAPAVPAPPVQPPAVEAPPAVPPLQPSPVAPPTEDEARGESGAGAPATGDTGTGDTGTGAPAAPVGPPPADPEPAVDTVTAAAPEPAAPSSGAAAPQASDTSSGGAAPPAASGRVHVVQAGESLWSIARGLADPGAASGEVARIVDQLWRLNSERIRSGSPDLIVPGERLVLPARG